MSPRVLFEQELEELKSKLAKMGQYVKLSYDSLFTAVLENDSAVLTELLHVDGKMKDMLRGIEANCLTLMTKQQPVAKDMRLVSAVLKVVTDIDRIGSHVSDVAELGLRRAQPFSQDICGQLLLSMMEESGGMLREAVEAFTEGDTQTAERVIGRDDAVDDLFNQIKEQMMEAIRQQTLDADIVVDDLLIAKYLEKIGDHAVNIGQWTIFQVTGDIDGVNLY